MQPDKLLNRNFVLLFQGQFVSQLGSFIYFVAIVFWIRHATDSATIVGLLALMSMLIFDESFHLLMAFVGGEESKIDEQRLLSHSYTSNNEQTRHTNRRRRHKWIGRC